MLARRSKIFLGTEPIAETPLLLPSFSSKGFPEVGKVIKLMSEFITSGVLISAYDFHHERQFPKQITFPEVIFLDSGGYELRVEHDFSEAYGKPHKPKNWTRKLYMKVLKNWSRRIPTIAVTFDSPREYLKLKQQIRQAKVLRDTCSGLLIDFLVKPERKSTFIPIETLVKHVKELRSFAAVGFAEKDLDSSLLGRMEKIARLRQAMDAEGVETPIHIFGSLDTIGTPLYFISGAEIFDGLTWLRFGYHKGYTLYSQNYGVIGSSDGLMRRVNEQTFNMWVSNYYYLQNLRDQMINYVRTARLAEFKYVGENLEAAYEQLQARTNIKR